jgi:hypothetical protein
MTVNWKKWLDNGTLGKVSKTHLIHGVHKLACGKKIPKESNVEVEYFDSNYHDCKACAKAYAKNPEAY